MTRIEAVWLTDVRTQAVLSLLGSAGHLAYAVGGCVRNTLLGQPVGDIDIATSARPDAVTDLASGAGIRVVPTGLEHGTVTLVSAGQSFEVTTFRKDIATDGRRATVAFADRIEDDAARRDFTINALYADASGTVLDPIGGLPDLGARRIRFIGKAGDRIREDYLRSLRFFRFQAWYGDPADGPDPEGLAAIADALEGLDILAAERVGAEMLKLLAAPDPAPAAAAMERTGVLSHILPGATTEALAPLVHLEGEANRPADPIRRLAALGGEDVEKRLRLSRADTRQLREIVDLAAGTASAAEIAWRHGSGMAWDAFLLRYALLSSPLPHPLSDDIAAGAAAQFPIRAEDLPNGLEGRAIGDALRRLETLWIGSGFTLDKRDLLAQL